MMQPKGGPRLLITDRDGALYLERARIHVEGERVVYHITDDEHRREYNIPHVNLAVLFIGQGTSITQRAMRLLGEEGVHVAITGSGGSPLHMGGLTNYTATHHFRAMLPVYLDENLSLIAAKSVMRDRAERMRKIGGSGAQKYLGQRDVSSVLRMSKSFEAALEGCGTISQLLGVEGNFAKASYAEFSRMSGLSKAAPFRRESGLGDTGPIDRSDRPRMVNRLIDHGNYLCYGIAGAALWALGVPPHMSIFHGKTRAGGLVFDVADSFKDSLVLPMAFAAGTGKKDEDPEKTFRGRLIDAFNNREILKAAIETVNRMIVAADPSLLKGSNQNA